MPLLVGSVAVNYVAARAFYATKKSWIVVAAIALDWPSWAPSNTSTSA